MVESLGCSREGQSTTNQEDRPIQLVLGFTTTYNGHKEKDTANVQGILDIKQ